MKEFTKSRFALFFAAWLLGYVFHSFSIPIPYVLGGIVVAFVSKTFIDKDTKWPALWRNLMMCVAGYEIGRSCTVETIIDIIDEVGGVLIATVSIIIVSILASIWIYKRSNSNLISCVMGCSPGGMSLMTVLAEEDKRADMNLVVVGQSLRLFCVVASVPFLAMQMMEDPSAVTAIPTHDEWPWPILIPICVVGYLFGKKFKLPSKQLLGPILFAALFSVLVHPTESAPHLLMIVTQLNIGLYIGTQLEKDRLVALGSTMPHLVLTNAVMIGVSVAMAVFLSDVYGFTLITAFLAMAPGGIAEMCIAGLAMGADVPIILAYQLFRLLTINFLSPYLINWYFKDSTEENT